MTPNAPSEALLPSKSPRSTYSRTGTIEAKYCPVQLARAQLGDTQRAMHLPGHDSSPSLNASSTVSISLLGGPGTELSAPVGIPPLRFCSQHAVPARKWSSRLGRRDIHPSSDKPSQDRMSVMHDAVKLNPTSPSSVNSKIVSNSVSSCVSKQQMDSDNASFEHSKPMAHKKVEYPVARIVDVQGRRTHMDGACDEGTVETRLQFEDNSTALSDRRKFQSFSLEHPVEEHYTGRNAGGEPPFLDPFTGAPVVDDRRASNSSSVSGYLRQNAFAGHRDTLARYGLSKCIDPENLHPKYGYPDNLRSDDETTEARKRFAGHRDTLVRLRFDRNKSKLVSTPILFRIVKYLSFKDYQSLRSTCRQWYEVLPCPTPPPASRLPAEVLQQIYQYLEPCEFDAARHTSRSWLLASLNSRLGLEMINKAGCCTAHLADIDYYRAVSHSKHLKGKGRAPSDDNEQINNCCPETEVQINKEWLMSRRLATEARLSANWHGACFTDKNGFATSRLATTEIVDFSRLSIRSDDDDVVVKRFTASACGRFVLVIIGTDIFIYSLRATGPMQPCLRLVAGREVLNVSMDTSSGRYAVAAVLQGRVGMCWELCNNLSATQCSNRTGESMSLGIDTDLHASSRPHASSVTTLSLPERRHEGGFFHNRLYMGQRLPSVALASIRNRIWRNEIFEVSPSLLSESPEQQFSPSSSKANSLDLMTSVAALPIVTKPSNVYQNIGSAYDNPSSVAICPQRKCVAFGCKNGIELHWVDASTGRDLNRWFPLYAPSDFLSFLPAISGTDSKKKLRLISSTAGPSRRKTSRHNSTPSKSKSKLAEARYGRRRSLTRLFFGSLPFPSRIDSEPGQLPDATRDQHEDQGVLRTVDCDHYHAVPLSDGVHMLFTEPETGLLCLGSDAPLGSPNKLLRKVCMTPPVFDQVPTPLLNCYAAGRELRWGVRVVAAYEDGSIVLFNIPSDQFDRVRHIRSVLDVWNELGGVIGESDLAMDALMDSFDRYGHDGLTTAELLTASVSSRSLQIDGAHICQVEPDVEDLQVDSHGGGLRLWIFHRSGLCRRMELYVPPDHSIRYHTIGVDGLLHSLPECSDEESNGSSGSGLEASDSAVEQSSNGRIRYVGLDGTADHVEALELKDDQAKLD